MKFILLFLFTICMNTYPQGVDYFPANVGDTWEWYSLITDSTYKNFISRIDILADSSLDIFYDDKTTPRYHLANDGNVYQYILGSEVLWYDFSLAPGDTFEVVIYSEPYYVVVDSTIDQLFGKEIPVRTFSWINKNYPSYYSFQKLSQKHGLYSSYSWFGPANDYVIGCIIDGIGYGTLVSVKDDYLFCNYSLKQNYPNPFNSATTIEYSIPKSSNVIIKIYNSLGEEIKEIENIFREAGNYKIIFNADALVSGVYYYKIIADGFLETKKFVYLK